MDHDNTRYTNPVVPGIPDELAAASHFVASWTVEEVMLDIRSYLLHIRTIFLLESCRCLRPDHGFRDQKSVLIGSLTTKDKAKLDRVTAPYLRLLRNGYLKWDEGSVLPYLRNGSCSLTTLCMRYPGM